MYESIPHTYASVFSGRFSSYSSLIPRLAVFFARIFATSWSAYVLWRTGDIKDRFYNLVTQPDSPCHIELFSEYFKAHRMFEVGPESSVCNFLIETSTDRRFRAERNRFDVVSFLVIPFAQGTLLNPAPWICTKTVYRRLVPRFSGAQVHRVISFEYTE
jgi:hypothetical protein